MIKQNCKLIKAIVVPEKVRTRRAEKELLLKNQKKGITSRNER